MSRVQIQQERYRAKRRAQNYKPGPYIPLEPTQSIRSVYEWGDCLILHDNGCTLYVPAREHRA